MGCQISISFDRRDVGAGARKREAELSLLAEPQQIMIQDNEYARVRLSGIKK
jgi:hypothetical protein